MALKPNAEVTRDLLAGARTLVPLACLYTLLLAASWTPESLELLLPGSFSQGVANMKAGKFSVQFLPTIDSVGRLLSEPLASLSAWAHLQFISFFLARWIWMDGVHAHQLRVSASCPTPACVACYRVKRCCMP